MKHALVGCCFVMLSSSQAWAYEPPIVVEFVEPWRGEQGVTVETPGLAPRPRAYTSAIVYRPDGSSFRLGLRPVRGTPTHASLRWPQQRGGSVAYVTVEQGTSAFGMSVSIP